MSVRLHSSHKPLKACKVPMNSYYQILKKNAGRKDNELSFFNKETISLAAVTNIMIDKKEIQAYNNDNNGEG